MKEWRGLIAAVVVAVAGALMLFLRSPATDTSGSAAGTGSVSVAPSQASGAAPSSADPGPTGSTSTTAATTSVAPPPAVDGSGEGQKEQYPPPVPVSMSGPRGQTAYLFVLAYSAYNPQYPDPGVQWLKTWKSYASAAIAKRADRNALLLYQFTVTSQVSVVNPIVAAVRVIRDSEGQSIYELTVSRVLLPFGATEKTPGSKQIVGWRVTVNDADPGPLVDLVVFLPGGATDGTAGGE